MLKFNPDWRFTSPGPIASGVIPDLFNLIRKIATQGDRKAILEHFKSQFAISAEVVHNYSSSAGWAEEDLKDLMYKAGANGPLFLEAFYDGFESASKIFDVGLPEIEHVNRILLNHETAYQIRPPDLISGAIAETITVEPALPSLDDQARHHIHNSLKISEEFLASGKYRQAVQEILWLLETISTAFRGIEIGNSTVQGKYFNKIAEELRRHHKGTTFDRVLEWTVALHGYLSSPTGGGVRHGTDLDSGAYIQANEARLFCNLIRSYINYIVAEYDRLRRL